MNFSTSFFKTITLKTFHVLDNSYYLFNFSGLWCFSSGIFEAGHGRLISLKGAFFKKLGYPATVLVSKNKVLVFFCNLTNI